MKKLFAIAAILAVFTSCHQINGSGNIVTEKRSVGEFNGVEAGGAFEVEIKSGPVVSVEVEADDNLVPYIRTDVSSGILRIKTKDGANFRNGHYKILITATDLNELKASGAASIDVKDLLKSAGKISLKTSGAAKIKAEVDAPDVDADASGAATIDLSGRTRNYNAETSGSGNINSFQLQSENTEVKASGAGSAHVHASVSLKANASGAGNITYKGGAAVQQNTSGAGTVKKEE